MIEGRFDPQVWSKGRMDRTKAELAWTPGTAAAMRGWQRRLRGRLRTLVGVPKRRPQPVPAEILEVRHFDGYRRETVRFESRSGLDAFGYFLVPSDVPPNSPAVLCLPGHGRGVEVIVGIREDGSQRGLDAPEEYAADFALQCVARGYPTFALEQISFGSRRDAQAIRDGAGSSCGRDSMAALMLGETMMGWRISDAMRALEYLAERPEVNGRRLAVMGISGGGATAFWTACLDTRIRCAVVSCYFNTFRDSILSVDHCVDNYVPGVLNAVEMPDMAGLVAPRALFAESGSSDPIFPVASFEKAAARAREIYAAFGAADQFDTEVFDGGHRFHGAGAFRFLSTHL